MSALTNLHRYEPLTESTLPRAFDVLRTVFTPDALAQQVTCRLAQLIGCGAVLGANLTIALDRHRTRTATTVGVFVDDQTRAQFQVIPLEQFDEWLVNDVLRVHGGVLTRQDIGRENAGPGLHLLILCFKAQDRDTSDTDRTVIVQEMMSRLFPEYLGYNLKSLTGRIRHAAQVFSGIQAGCRLLRPGTMPLPPPADDLFPHPVLITADRETVEFAAWISSAFVSRRPRLRFTSAEQRTLALAVHSYSDSEIASSCGVSGSTVKKRWDSILAKASAEALDVRKEAQTAESLGRRGVEKRTNLISYIAAHPEELRPYLNRSVK
jgi:DNA-binding CsgD family transcriptional regulator